LQVYITSKKERTLKDIFSSQLQQVKNITELLSERVKRMEVDIEKVSNLSKTDEQLEHRVASNCGGSYLEEFCTRV
jgi:hypothetical protein